MNILYYEPSSGFGGSPRSLRDILVKLDKSRYRPIVVVLDDGPAIREIASLGYEVVSIFDKKGMAGPVYTPRLTAGLVRHGVYLVRRVIPRAFILARLIRRRNVDVVHVNTLIRTGLEAILAGWMTGRPVICHLRSTCKWTRIEKMAARLVTKCISLTDDAKDLYRQYLPPEKSVRIYNGIDLQSGRYSGVFKDIRPDLGISSRAKIVGLVGRITPGKGHEVFLGMAALLRQRLPEAVFLIVGDSLSEGEAEFKTMLMRRTAELGLSDTLRFTGWRDDILDVIAGLDVLVQASTTFPEGFSRTCVEAMAVGVPVVVTRIPGASEIVEHGVSGLVVQPGSVEGMSGAVCSLLESPELRLKLIKGGRASISEKFDLGSIVRQIEMLYAEVARDRLKGAP